MAAKKKKALKKKIVVVRRGQALKAEEKPAYAHKVKDACQNSAVFNGSPALQALQGSWITTADLLAGNFAKQAVARSTLLLLEADVPGLVIDCDNAEAEFATGVQTASKDDATIAAGMGMGVKADKAPAVEAAVPTGVRIARLKTTNAPVLTWDVVPSAHLYLAQMSVDPATEASWVSLYGKGKTRTLPPLVPGQHYVFRVGALDVTGKPTGWSALVTFIG